MNERRSTARRRPAVAALLLLAALFPCAAQESAPADSVNGNSDGGARVRLGVTAGVSLMSSRDLAASPLAYSGTAFPVGLTLEIAGELTRHHLAIGGASSANNGTLLRSSATREGRFFHVLVYEHVADWTVHRLEYRFSHRIGRIADAVDLSIAGELANLLFDREYWYYNRPTEPENDVGDPSWDDHLTLGLGVDAALTLAGGRLRGEATLALAALSFRPTWSITGDITTSTTLGSYIEWGELVSLDRLRQVELAVDYSFPIADHVELGGELSLLYYRNEASHVSTTVMTGFTLSCSYLF